MCKHDGFYTCIGRYDRTAGRLVYSMVCDECHATVQTVLEQAYEPHFVKNERPPDSTGMEARMDAIRLKQILGGPLTDQELMCLQIEQNGFGCASCLTSVPSAGGSVVASGIPKAGEIVASAGHGPHLPESGGH